MTPQFAASLTIVIDDTSQGYINETFIVQASLTIITYDRKNMFIIQATGLANFGQLSVTTKKKVSKH